MSQGFYYRWDWPNGEDTEWLEARSTWHRLVRNYLLHHNTPGMDSPALLATAAETGIWREGRAAFSAWSAVVMRPIPPTVPVWVDDSIVQFAAKWAKERARRKQRAIIWYEQRAMGEALSGIAGLPLYAGGDGDPDEGEPIIVCSRSAYGTGKNLQAWSWNLVLCPMANGSQWEQLIGRTHRPGQLADEVFVELLVHTPELEGAWQSARKDALYMEQSTGAQQKILFGNVIDLE
jgi:hypothetical protein